MCVCERLCVGAHGGISIYISLRIILSFLARPRVTSSPNHSNGATIQHMFGSAPIGAVSQHTNSLATLVIPLGGRFTPYPNSGASIDCSRASENGTSPYPVAYPAIFFGGVQQFQMRTEDRENRDLGAIAP